MKLRKILAELADTDIDMLLDKGNSYGDSWKKRGGVGAFMMLARKWDRIENLTKRYNYDVFAAIEAEPSIVEDIQDLGCYLWLVRRDRKSVV